LRGRYLVGGAAGTAPARGSFFYTGAMVWEFIFMMLILKIPIAYLGCVVYWAVKAEPKPPEPAVVHAQLPGPEPREPWRPRPRTRGPRSGPHGSPHRKVARASTPTAR
jgi:hypothetical protein